jgi:Uma2 family endonuclease
MSAVKKLNLISVEDYLEGELVSPVKHEYLGGVVYAMAGARNVHNTIASNCLVALGSHLRGKQCQAFNSDTKVRVRLSTHTRFYYPDAMVVCKPNPQNDSFQDQPVVIAEVLSAATRRIDEGEKKDTYLAIPTLTVYLLIESDRPRVVVHRRGADGAFSAELYEGIDSVIALDDIGCALRLSELYERVDFTAAREPEPAADSEA